MSDPTGNVNKTVTAGTWTGCIPTQCSSSATGVQPWDDSHCNPDPPAGTPPCFSEAGDTCEVERDADGNASPCDGCGGAQAGGGSGAAFNGFGQPLLLSQPSFDGSGGTYTFEYDPLGRRTVKDVVAAGAPELIENMFVAHAHSVNWSYDDAAGVVTRVYDRPADLQPIHPTPGLPVTTVTETDPAGRVISITQNGQVTTYAYADSTMVPAVVETKPDNTVSEYYVDIAGQTAKIVHKDSGGNEVLAFQYTRDAKGRVTRVDEYVNGGPTANVTTYVYGDGRLLAADLDADSASAVEPGKLYYSWFATPSPSSFQASDPNRLVKETRTGSQPYQNEYWYDVGGNRLAMRSSEWVETSSGVWGFVTGEFVPYNYAHKANVDGYDPRVASNPSLGVAQPDPSAVASEQPIYRNTYGQGMKLGQDKLLSRRAYRFDLATGQYDGFDRFVTYAYDEEAGKLSRKRVWDGASRVAVDTVFTYSKNRLRSALIDETVWPTDPLQFPDDNVPGEDRNRTLEAYAYNIFGERIGVQHCAVNSGNTMGPLHWDDYPLAAASCKGQVRIYDYVDGQLLCERESDNFAGQERNISVYTWGLMGLVARRGTSMRDGTYDAATHTFTESEVPNGQCDYTYMMDQMGNVAALVNSATGNAKRQVFDSFGNNLGGYITFRCASDYDTGEWLQARVCDPPSEPGRGCHGPDAATCNPPCPDPLPDAQPVERMQTGNFNWRGGEGSITDRVAEEQRDKRDVETLRHSAYTKPSTGLIYMQARYYEPETGRFTQADALAYGFETIFQGQNNRWLYCANDPINCSDPSGRFAAAIAIGGLAGSGSLPLIMVIMLVVLLGLSLVILLEAIPKPDTCAFHILGHAQTHGRTTRLVGGTDS